MITNNMVLPKIEGDATSQKYGRFIISPLEQGYGITIGNALRRVLLSSLPGAAVTSIRVSGVHHEFSAIPYVREDMTQFILQVKQLRLKLFDTESARLRLEVRGEGTITAADIICPPEVEIVNPDLYLFTVDAPDAQFEVEFTVQSGRGFSPSEERGRLPIGELPVDAIFSPIRRVNYDVERARVGQKTNYDKLILEIYTDGSINAQEALVKAAQVLSGHIAIFSSLVEEEGMVDEGGIFGPPTPAGAGKELQVSIEELELPVRVLNCLHRGGISTLGQLIEKTEDDLLALRSFGARSIEDVKEKLAKRGLSLRSKEE